ncbi:MAG: TonB-dependent receptor [Gammaproteobacteria bacterium]|nr:TonB-dependent receptor [Gammaproteobacteria bacterium]MDE0284399.1 TonB-dependent receptor [Gammaproteobacteria bacterium]MDE0512232.1 TonB-dependent receptor [Gammaproteobacteria bacterium]
MQLQLDSLPWYVMATILLFPLTGYSQIEEIVVTAQKREENLQDTPIAITAFTEEALEARMINDISKLADFTPNVIFDTTTPISGLSNGAAVFIRGIGQLDFAMTTDPGVGTYIDGVYSSRAVGGVLDVVDIERIEILRGSQGTLFGRNTIGGAINITTKRPAKEFGGMVEATFGEFERRDFKGSLDVPVTDKFRTKFAFSSKNRNGFVDRVLVGDRLGDEDRQSVRGSFLLQPTDAIDLYATVDYTSIDEQSAGTVMVGITEFPGEPSQGLAPSSTWAYNQVFVPANPGVTPYSLEEFLPDRKDQTYATGLNGTDLEIFGSTLTFSWSLPWFEFKSITSYRETEGNFYRDPDNSPAQITESYNPDYNHEQLSQEVQLTGQGFNDRLDYVLGAYYFEEDGEDFVFVPIYGAIPTPGGLLGLPLYINNFMTIDNTSKAIFGQGTFDITEQLAVTFGMRYTEDKKGFGYRQYISPDDPGGGATIIPGIITVAAILGPPIPAPGPADALIAWDEVSDQFSELNFRAGLEYQLNDDTLLYFTYADGYKSGGFNFRYVVSRVDPLPFDPETLESYEVGFKWQGLDDRLRVNAAGFISEYGDVQIQLFETGGGPLTQNAGVADIIGVEVELTAVPHERLLLNAGFGYIDAEYDELNLPTTNVAQAVNLDTKLPNTPETTVNVSAEYNHPLPWGSLSVRGDYRYTDDLYNDAQNSPFLYQDGYSMVNASVSLTVGGWEFSVFGVNLTDKRVITSGDSNFGLGFHEANYNRPREFGGLVRYRF